MSRVSNLFGRNEMYQEQTDFFNDDNQIWTAQESERRTSGDKLGPWSRAEAETQAANVKALLQDQLRREKPLSEASNSPQPQAAQERSEKRRSRRRDSGGGHAAFDFPQDWLSPKSAERDVWPPVGTSTSRSPQPTNAWPAAVEVLAHDERLQERKSGRRGNSGRHEAGHAGSGQFDEAILAALTALPRNSLIDVLRRLGDQRPEEVCAALGNVANRKEQSEQTSPATTATGATNPLLSPPKSEVTRGISSSNCSPVSAPAKMQPQSEAASEQDPRVSLSVADMVAAAADAADGSPALSQGWPADASSVWPRSDLWPSQLPWPSEVDGVTWYDVEVTNESGRSWIVQRRYNDFAQLDEVLQRSKSLELLPLPGKESLNPLKLIDRDGFLDRRTDGLKAYLEKLAVQVQTTAQDPILEQFLQVDLSSKPDQDSTEPEAATSVVEFSER